MSLSLKLALLLLAALGCVLIPAMFITYAYVGENALRADKEKFIAALQVAEENIDAGFMRLNQAKVEGAMRAKRRLRAAARLFAGLLEPPDAAGAPGAPELLLASLRRKQQRENAAEGLQLELFSPGELRAGRPGPLGLRGDLADIMGRSLDEILENLPEAGRYSFFRLTESDPRLFYFMPAGEEMAVAAAISIQDLLDEAEDVFKALPRALKNRFASLPLYPGGFIVLFDQEGARLAGAGFLGDAERSAMEPVITRARSAEGVQESVLRTSEGQEYLVAASFSRPFQWTTVMAAPLGEINAPTHALVTRLAAQNLGLGLAVVCFFLFLLRRALAPLRLLVRKIAALPDMDFSSPQSHLDLPLNRRDEVGDLARAFAAMSGKLRLNVRALMDSTALKERLQGELSAAREIQRGILPPPELAPNIYGVSSAAMLEPAREVGGDLYYFFTLPDGRYAFAIGDVSGKGVPAALFMAITVTLTRYALAAESDPGAALGRINAMLEAHNTQTMFVTLFLALYNPETGLLNYANAGHNQPLLASGGSVAFLEGLSGPMVGVMPEARYQSFSRVIEEGELCLLYTDGVTEAIDEAEDIYGEERLAAYMAAHGAENPKKLLNGIFEDVKRFRGEAAAFDDITMLAFARR